MDPVKDVLFDSDLVESDLDMVPWPRERVQGNLFTHSRRPPLGPPRARGEIPRNLVTVGSNHCQSGRNP